MKSGRGVVTKAQVVMGDVVVYAPGFDSAPGLKALVGREWKNGSNSSYNCTPFLHSLLTKGKVWGFY